MISSRLLNVLLLLSLGTVHPLLTADSAPATLAAYSSELSRFRDESGDAYIAVFSEKSVDRAAPVDFPDFTKGRWKTTPPIKLMSV